MKTLLGLIFSVCCFGTTLTGTLSNPDGSGANGRLYLNVAQQAALSTTGGCGGPIEITPSSGKGIQIVVTNGVMAGTPTVYGSDCMLPQGVFYNVEFDDAQGNVLFVDRWIITGSSINIGTIVSAVILGTTGTLGSTGVVLGNPPGSQTIQQPASTLLNVNYFNVTGTMQFPNGATCNSSGCNNLLTNVVDLTSNQAIAGIKTFTQGLNVDTCNTGCGYQAIGTNNSQIAFQTLNGVATPFQVDIGGDVSLAGQINLTGVGSVFKLRGTTIVDDNGNFLGAGVDVCANLAMPYTFCVMGAGDGIGARRFNAYDGTSTTPHAGQDYTIGFNGSQLTVNGTPVTNIIVTGGVVVNSM